MWKLHTLFTDLVDSGSRWLKSQYCVRTLYFPKVCDFLNLSHEAVQMMENTLNFRPRKVLGFQSLLEFAEAMMDQPCVALQGGCNHPRN